MVKKKTTTVGPLSMIDDEVCGKRLSAVEIAFNEFEHFFLVAFNFAAESFVAIRAQFLDDAVAHCGREYIVSFENGALAVEAVGRCFATVG